MLLVFCCSFDRKDNGGRRSKNSGVAVAVAIKTENGPVRNAQVRASKRESGSCTQRHDGFYLKDFDKEVLVFDNAPSMSLSPVRQKEQNTTLTDRADRQPVSTTDLELAKSLSLWASDHLPGYVR